MLTGGNLEKAYQVLCKNIRMKVENTFDRKNIIGDPDIM